MVAGIPIAVLIKDLPNTNQRFTVASRLVVNKSDTEVTRGFIEVFIMKGA